MFKIMTRTEDGTTILQIEGKLTSPWLKELACYWQEVIGSHQLPVLVDLTGVTFIDAEGKAVLTQMWRQGATFHATGCLNTSIVKDITIIGRTDSSDRVEAQ